jgi:diguanylate cyclase (GGDEF)-like protein/PAS domain S-box-containing protein
MLENVNIQTLYLIIAVIVSSFICFYAWHRQARGSRTFAIVCLSSIVWMSGNIIGRFSESFTRQWIGELITYIGIVTLPVALYVFTNQYCGKKISRQAIIKLSIIPAVSWLMLLTNPLHYLFFKTAEAGFPSSLDVTFGYYFWFVHTPYSYFLILASFAIILLEISRTSRHFRLPLFLFFISMCLPFIINVLTIFKIFGTRNYTTLSFPLFFVVAAIAIYRFQFLGSNPIAYENVFQTIRDGVVIVDQNNKITDINPAAARTLRKSSEEIIGKTFEEVFSNWEDVIKKYENVLELEDEVEIDLRGKKRFISVTIVPLKNTDDSINGRIFTFRDITDRLRHQLSLELLAFQDPLTCLANRLKFQQEVEITLEKSMTSLEPFAILYCDLDRFKAVNDTMGHQAGDELLKYVAARISSVLRKHDLLARLGGDEFAVLLRKTDKAGVQLVVERILENIQMPFKIGEQTLIAEMSIGAAFYPDHGENFSELLLCADKAMYQAKSKGGGLALFAQ